MTCIDCGKEMKRKSPNHKWCADCAERNRSPRDLAYEEERKARRRAERDLKTLACSDCGLEVRRNSSQQKRCSSCSKKSRKDGSRRRYAGNPRRHRREQARYRSKNPEAISEYKAKYRAENPEAVSEYMRKWRHENPSLVAESNRKRRELDKSINANRSRCTWSTAEDAALMTWTRGDRELGAALGRSVDSVRGRRKKLRKRAAEQSTRNEGLKP